MKKPQRRQPEPPPVEDVDSEETHDMGALKELPASAEMVAALGQQTSLAIALTKAEVDQQITTARAYPRSITTASEAIISLATLDTETAIECVYELPRGGKIIKGASIRFADICASQWGNCRDASRVVHVDRFEKFVEAEGVFHDLQTGRVTVSRVRRRIFDRHGRIFDDDLIMVTGQAACAIARRNAILAGVPKGVWRRAYDAALSVIKGDAKTLVERRDTAMKAFAGMGVSAERVFQALDVKGLKDIDLDKLSELTAMRKAIKDGEGKIEQLFPEIKEREPAPRGPREKLEALSGASGPSSTVGSKAPDKPAGGAAPLTSPAGDNRFADHEGQMQERHEREDGRHMGDPTNPPPAASGPTGGDHYPDEDEAQSSFDMGDER